MLTGLGGADTLRGAGGSDNLRANDGVADDLNCGPGIDSASADLADRGPVRGGGVPAADGRV